MSNLIKEWMTAKEIANLKISGFPQSITGVHYYARKKGIHLDPSLCRRREGTTGFEYHKSIIAPALDDQLLWLSAEEIASMSLPGMPKTIEGVQAKLRRDVEKDSGLFVRQFGVGGTLHYHRSLISSYEEKSPDWFNAEEIARMRLPGFPFHRETMRRHMTELGVTTNPRLCRLRSGSGGGFEYHIVN